MVDQPPPGALPPPGRVDAAPRLPARSAPHYSDRPIRGRGRPTRVGAPYVSGPYDGVQGYRPRGGYGAYRTEPGYVVVPSARIIAIDPMD